MADVDALEADLCVVGTGAAGLTIALRFAGSGVRVVLLEGGGISDDGGADGGIYRVAYGSTPRLEIDANLRWQFGGNTNHWFGNCRPLDSADFEARDWIPHSGWPIERAALEPFYRAAQRLCGLADFGAYDVDTWQPELRRLADIDPATLTPKLVQTCPAPRFEQLHGPSIRAADNLRLCLRVRAEYLETDAAGDTVRAVVGRDAQGRPVRVSAGAIVLAAGGIENPRLLLSSTDRHPNGLGNAHDLVGRFFMEHPFVDVPLGASSHVCDLLFQPRRQRIGDTTVWALLALSDAFMRRERALGLSLWAPPIAAPREAAAGRRLPALMKQAWRGISNRGGAAPAAGRFLRVAIEQAPDPRNRVRLSAERDRFGLPAAAIVYRVSDEDAQRHARSLSIAARGLGLDGERIADAMQRRWQDGRVYFFGHHMGTTRMHPDPRRGVVDSDCRVHGVSNLFIAGSSVFPTGGTATPTLTIVALAARLAEHLFERVLPAAARVG